MIDQAPSLSSVEAKVQSGTSLFVTSVTCAFFVQLLLLRLRKKKTLFLQIFLVSLLLLCVICLIGVLCATSRIVRPKLFLWQPQFPTSYNKLWGSVRFRPVAYTWLQRLFLSNGPTAHGLPDRSEYEAILSERTWCSILCLAVRQSH